MIKVIISEDESKKLEQLNDLNGCVKYINPENNKHPKVQKEFIEEIIQTYHTYNTDLVIATNSPYILTTLNNLLYAGKLKGKITEERFIEIMGNVSNYIYPSDIAVLNLDTGKSMIDEDNGEIIIEEIDTVSDKINEQYTQLYYEDVQ